MHWRRSWRTVKKGIKIATYYVRTVKGRPALWGGVNRAMYACWRFKVSLAYHHCASCQRGYQPWRKKLKLGQV
jgi:hypothetical protein